jgi:hypothetical protein
LNRAWPTPNLENISLERAPRRFEASTSFRGVARSKSQIIDRARALARRARSSTRGARVDAPRASRLALARSETRRKRARRLEVRRRDCETQPTRSTFRDDARARGRPRVERARRTLDEGAFDATARDEAPTRGERGARGR